MAINDKFPTMSDVDLKSLRANAERLEQSGTAGQKAEATRLLPLISAEIDARVAAKPVLHKAIGARRKAAAPKAVAAKPAASKSKLAKAH